MKKLLLTAAAVTCAVSVFGQGQVVFNNRVVGTLVTHVYYNPAITFQVVGNGSNDTPAGTTSWAGYSLVGVNLNGQYGASTTFAQLLALDGAGKPESSLVPSSVTTTFRSGAGAGFLAGINGATLSGVAIDSPAATIEMVVWDNSSGLYPTWAQASVAWNNGLIAAGKSGAITLNAIGGGLNIPPNLTGLQSFNIFIVPEPATMALFGLGAAALLIFRRRN